MGPRLPADARERSRLLKQFFWSWKPVPEELEPQPHPGGGIPRILLISKTLRFTRIDSPDRDQRTFWPMVVTLARVNPPLSRFRGR